MSPPPMVTSLAYYPKDNNIFDGWKKLKDKQLQIQGNQVSVCETQIQFHPDQINFLVVHHSHLAIYELATELKCVNQWLPEVPIIHISQATFSSDGHTVYSIFGVAIFDASNFEIGFRVYRSCYLPTISRWGGVYPISVAAHPQKPVQFAVGLLDGSVYVFEPRMPGGDWIKNH
ncbi:hypothetical protein JHK84_048307 [Glycine max]|nr:hypothetical protein JHK85_048907 [Glycine max]KAG5103338.1 hypothetical protein JHK84_048307 [Glycine max]